jgi:hypothetical protein
LPDSYYELVASDLLSETEAKAVCLIVLEGSSGTAAVLKVNTRSFKNLGEIIQALPAHLRKMAEDIEDGKTNG